MINEHADTAAPAFPRLDALPPDFAWGASTAAFQIEGARFEDGRGRSIWDDFVERPGAVVDGSTADTADDSYHAYLEDVALLARLGVDDYRFSISWPRILPSGSGAVNQAGLDYYSRLVDALLEAGISPVATLYHWDLPSALEAEGGWLERDTAFRFAEYAGILAAALGDRVGRWITLNEPAMVTLQGYALGEHAPGLSLLFDALPTAHNQLLAHGLAVSAIRAETTGASIGIANNHTPVVPASENDRDAAALYDLLHNRIFAEPVITGAYPDVSALGLETFPGCREGDERIIAAHLDFYGINYYNATRVRVAQPSSDAALSGIPFELTDFPDAPVTGFGWPIQPRELTEMLGDFAVRYRGALPPLIITENGCSFPDPATPGAREDSERIAYLREHINAVNDAVSNGADVVGYYVWTLMDNFEWERGYTQRFGLVHVNFDTNERTPRQSFDWYAQVISQSKGA